MKIALYKGRTRIFNRFVSWWTNGKYSHCEAIFDTFYSSADYRYYKTRYPEFVEGAVLCASSSFMDKGVRLKWICLTPDHWDIIDVPNIDEKSALKWYESHVGDKYDVMGLLAVISPLHENKVKYFCSESICAAIGIKESWRFNPNVLAIICEWLGGIWIQK